MRFGNIEISDKRFRDISFNGAKKECKILGDDWRLPTEIEMTALFDFLNSLGPERRVGQFIKDEDKLKNDDKSPLYWTAEGSIIRPLGIYRIYPSFLRDVSSIMVRDI
jgi:hypothetical protein